MEPLTKLVSLDGHWAPALGLFSCGTRLQDALASSLKPEGGGGEEGLGPGRTNLSHLPEFLRLKTKEKAKQAAEEELRVSAGRRWRSILGPGKSEVYLLY